ncbi:MAG: NfeD family protein [Candidatus Firestonebacteria bacterium]
MKITKIFLTLITVFMLTSYAKTVKVAEFHGVVNQISSVYLAKVIADAEAEKAECVIIEMDTQGGIDASIKEVVNNIMESGVPVVAFISPKGAISGPAGIPIAMASDYIAMAPGTQIGVSQTVDLSGQMASEKSMKEAVEYIKSIAVKKGRKTAWVDDIIEKNLTLTETKVLEMNIIDSVNENVFDLLSKLNGKKIKGKILDLKGAEVINLEMTGKETLLHLLGNPNVAYILFVLGILAIIFEFAAPGIGLPGIGGAICVILAIFSFTGLPVSIAGIIMILLAIGLFVFEIKTPAHGAFAVGGVLALFLGSLLIFNPMVPYFRISMSIVITILVLTSAFFAFLITLGLSAMKGKVVIGIGSLLNATGEVKVGLDPVGIVYINREDWSAESNDGQPIDKGEKVRVLKVEGVKLIVERIKIS